DVAVRELIRQLRGGLAEDVHQAEPEGWLQGCRDSASGVGNRVVAHGGDGFEIPLECFDEGRHVHVGHYDITMMSCQAPNGVTERHHDTNPAPCRNFALSDRLNVKNPPAGEAVRRRPPTV